MALSAGSQLQADTLGACGRPPLCVLWREGDGEEARTGRCQALSTLVALVLVTPAEQKVRQRLKRLWDQPPITAVHSDLQLSA